MKKAAGVLDEGEDRSDLTMLIGSDGVDGMSRSDVDVIEDGPTVDGGLEGDKEDLRRESANLPKSMFETADACEQVEDHHTNCRRVTE